ncbi:MAG: hypothetical protein HC802_04200 [Caldilineaceae bacterium]|nr:hypothetical protein [Caldilineaceae bacterium]
MPEEQVFLPSIAVTTLTTALEALWRNWQLLPADMREAIDVERSALADRLPAASAYGRLGEVVRFLGWLEAQAAVLALAGEVLRSGKGPAMRVVHSLSDPQTQEVVELLRRPAPPPVEASRNETVALDFYVNARFQEVGDYQIGQTRHLIVSLQREPAAKSIYDGRIVLDFANLNEVQPVEVVLNASGFAETTRSWNRTIHVYADRESLPAIFNYRADGSAGERGLSVQFYHALGAAGFTTEVTAPTEVMRSGASFLSGSSGESMTEEQPVDFFTNVDFPGQVRPRAVQALVVQLTLQAVATSVVSNRVQVGFANLDRPEVVEVVLTSSRFEDVAGEARRVMRVYSRADSQPALFLLKASDQLGPASIRLDFYHRGRMLGSAEFAPEITNDAIDAAQPLPRTTPAQELGAILVNPPPPADLELRIVYDAQDKELTFILHSTRPEVGYHWRSVGKMPLQATDPRAIWKRSSTT